MIGQANSFIHASFSFFTPIHILYYTGSDQLVYLLVLYINSILETNVVLLLAIR